MPPHLLPDVCMDMNIIEVLKSYCKTGFRKVFTNYVPAVSVIGSLSLCTLFGITYILMMEFDD